MRLSPSKHAAECGASLHGDLDDVGLATLLTMMDMERSSGVLFVHGRGGEVGRLWLRDGRVIRGRVEGRGRRVGKSAVFDVLGWGGGRFELVRADIDGADEIATPTTHLLMEAARREDEGGVGVGVGAGDTLSY